MTTNLTLLHRNTILELFLESREQLSRIFNGHLQYELIIKV